jgi:hypothetical protein
MNTSTVRWSRIYLGVALTTLATLLLELSLTRIFSVIFYYHFAFLVISIALFGLGVGGVLSYIVAGWKVPLYTTLGRLSFANALLVLAALALILTQRNEPSMWHLGLVYFSTALPFVLAGIIVSLLIAETIENVGRVYLFDLLGAAAGCLLLIPLLDLVGGPATVVSAAVIFAVTAAIWHGIVRNAAGCIASLVLVLLLSALVTYDTQQEILSLRQAKGYVLAHEIFHKWNSFSRVGVVPRDGQYWIVIDVGAATLIADVDVNRLTAQNRRALLDHGSALALPYVMRPGAKTLIIGSGGGADVASALASGSRDITAVEINPIIANTIMRERLPHLSRSLYLRPDVRVYVEDGRSFIRRSPEQFQVVQATLVDTWAATAAGAFALSENTLYTTDAFRDYLLHLTDNGLVAFSRWGFEPPRESLRLVSLAMEALAQLGEHAAWRHVIVAREGTAQGFGALDTVLIARKPFAETDLNRAWVALAADGMQALYVPGADIRNAFYDLLHSPDPRQYQHNYRFDISPVSDNRPFFFYTVQPRDLLAFFTTASPQNADFQINRAVPLLFGLMGVSLVATIVILVAPPLVLGDRLPRQRGVRAFLLYFLCIGAGYILVEVGLIQKFVLFLGHPTYALTGVIFSMLVSSGLGSAASRGLLGFDHGRLIKTLGCVAMLTAVLALIVASPLSALVWLPLSLKLALTVLLIAPLGFVMGMPFPTALRHLERWHAPAVRWAWSLNAAASVLGSVGALVCAIYLGLVQTLILGALFYLAALAVVVYGRPHGVAMLSHPTWNPHQPRRF